MDLIIRRASLHPDPFRPESPTGIQDIGIDGGRIVSVAPQLDIQALQEIDAQGSLVSPPFVDAHFHLDSTLTYGIPRVNQSGTLLEGISLWGELKPNLTPEALQSRALQYCDWAVARGIQAIRAHVDIGDPRLLAAEVLLGSRSRCQVT